MKNLYIILFVCMLGILSAANCEQRIDPSTSCTVFTPILSCSTDAMILKSDGTNTTTAMSSVGGGVYSFTFNQAEGMYSIILCDNSTTDISVRSTIDTALSTINTSINGIILTEADLIKSFFIKTAVSPSVIPGHQTTFSVYAGNGSNNSFVSNLTAFIYGPNGTYYGTYNFTDFVYNSTGKIYQLNVTFADTDNKGQYTVLFEATNGTIETGDIQSFKVSEYGPFDLSFVFIQVPSVSGNIIYEIHAINIGEAGGDAIFETSLYKATGELVRQATETMFVGGGERVVFNRTIAVDGSDYNAILKVRAIRQTDNREMATTQQQINRNVDEGTAGSSTDISTATAAVSTYNATFPITTAAPVVYEQTTQNYTPLLLIGIMILVAVCGTGYYYMMQKRAKEEAFIQEVHEEKKSIFQKRMQQQKKMI